MIGQCRAAACSWVQAQALLLTTLQEIQPQLDNWSLFHELDDDGHSACVSIAFLDIAIWIDV